MTTTVPPTAMAPSALHADAAPPAGSGSCPTPQLSRSSSASTLATLALPPTPPSAPVALPALPLPLPGKAEQAEQAEPAEPHACRDLTGAAISRPIKALLGPALAALDRPLRLVGLLATPDSGCAMYADMTARACRAAGVVFEKLDLRPAPTAPASPASDGDAEDARFAEVLAAIERLNGDRAVDGLLVYFPLFGGARDAALRSAIAPRIDVEGVSPASLAASCARPPPALEAVFAAPARAPAHPCTAAAVFRTLQHAGLPRTGTGAGTVAVINRSDTVGRPLAAMLARAGAAVFSVDVAGTQRWSADGAGALTVEDTDTPLPVLLAQSDAVVAAVPGTYTVPTAALKRGAVCVDLSEQGNFAPDVRDRAAVFAPRVGAVTISMLLCNALVLRAKHGSRP